MVSSFFVSCMTDKNELLKVKVEVVFFGGGGGWGDSS